jgi:hypothetical protein
MHDAFGRLGSLLEQNAGDINEAALVSAVLGESQAEQAKSFADRSQWLPLLAVAASLLLLLTLAYNNSKSTAERIAARDPVKSSLENETSLAWNDGWEEEVAELRSYSVSLTAPSVTSPEIQTWFFGEDLERTEAEWDADQNL